MSELKIRFYAKKHPWSQIAKSRTCIQINNRTSCLLEYTLPYIHVWVIFGGGARLPPASVLPSTQCTPNPDKCYCMIVIQNAAGGGENLSTGGECYMREKLCSPFLCQSVHGVTVCAVTFRLFLHALSVVCGLTLTCG